MASRLSVGKKYDNFESMKENLNLFDQDTEIRLGLSSQIIFVAGGFYSSLWPKTTSVERSQS